MHVHHKDVKSKRINYRPTNDALQLTAAVSGIMHCFLLLLNGPLHIWDSGEGLQLLL